MSADAACLAVAKHLCADPFSLYEPAATWFKDSWSQYAPLSGEQHREVSIDAIFSLSAALWPNYNRQTPGMHRPSFRMHRPKNRPASPNSRLVHAGPTCHYNFDCAAHSGFLQSSNTRAQQFASGGDDLSSWGVRVSLRLILLPLAISNRHPTENKQIMPNPTGWLPTGGSTRFRFPITGAHSLRRHTRGKGRRGQETKSEGEGVDFFTPGQGAPGTYGKRVFGASAFAPGSSSP